MANEKKTDEQKPTGDGVGPPSKPDEEHTSAAVYEESFRARVNREADQHEVILRGVISAHTFVLRNQPGTEGFQDGHVYRMVFLAAETGE